MRSVGSSLLQDIFYTEREKLKQQIARNLSRSMSSMIGHKATSDVLLVSADGFKLPVHLCIIRRSPIFFQRYVEPTLKALKARPTNQVPLEVAVGDVDFNGLSFFIRSIYTDEEIGELSAEQPQSLFDDRGDDNGKGSSSGGRNRSNRSGSKGFRDGLRDDFSDNRPTFTGNKKQNYTEEHEESISNSKNGSQAQLYDMTNKLPTDMSASFPSPGELQKRLNESDFTSQSATNLNLQAPPVMTSFREIANSQASLASDSPMCLSVSSEAEESRQRRSKSVASDTNGMCKFIRLDDSVASIGSQSSSARSESRNATESKSIFPMFIGVGAYDKFEELSMTQSVPPPSDVNSIRSRAILARKLSVSSLNSLTSIDLTPTHEGPPPIADKNPVNQLGADLLQMYLDSIDWDVTVHTNEGDLRAHRVILWATCPAFRNQLSKQKSIKLESFTKSTVNFLMMFLYGGLTCIPEDVDCFELVSLADNLQLDLLLQVAFLHLRTYRCHFFHRPCGSCVSAIFDALPKFQEIPALRPLFDEAMSWQARHFARIWKGKLFLHLSEHWQKACFDALIQDITESTVIDVLLGCERLQVALPRIKSQHSNQFVQRLVNDIVEFSTDFLITAFDSVISSKAFAQQGKGLALNLSLLEDIFPTLIHSLNPDTSIRTFICLKNLLLEILAEQKTERNIGSQRSLNGSSLSIHQNDEYNLRFFNLCKRLYELTDKHLLHYAASVIQAESWSLLTANEQNRIQESGIFVEMRLPKAPPPKFSSFNRAYKRSSSVGFQQSVNNSYERTRSLERARPVATFSQLLEADEPLEVIMEREKSQTQIQVHRRSASMRENSTSKMTLNHETTKLPSKMPIKRTANSEVRNQQSQSNNRPSQQHNQTTVKKEECVKANKPAAEKPPKKQSLESSPTKTKVEQKPKKEEPDTKVSPQRRPNNRPKHPPPTSQTRQPIPVPESIKLEREMTQTIMTVQQLKDRGINPTELGMPEIPPLKQSEEQKATNLCVSPAATLTLSTETLTQPCSPTPTVIATNQESAKAKPRSVVKPMPKAAVTPSKTSTPARKSTTAQPNTDSTVVRSSLPTRRPVSPNRPKVINKDVPISIDEKPKKTIPTRNATSKIPHGSPAKPKRT